MPSSSTIFSRANLEALTTTSPMAPLSIVTTFSVVNDFMFRPPESSYRARATDDDNAPDEDGTDQMKIRLVYIPWVHKHPADGRPMGGKPHPFHGGAPIPGLYIRHPSSPYLMLFFHGNACDIGFPSSSMLVLYAEKFRTSVLAVEYPGYGLHPGEPSANSIQRTAERVVQFILSTADPSFSLSRLIIMGQSIGTGCAVHVARRIAEVFGVDKEPVAPRVVEEDGARFVQIDNRASSVAALILKAPFTSVRNIATNNAEFGPQLKRIYRNKPRPTEASAPPAAAPETAATPEISNGSMSSAEGATSDQPLVQRSTTSTPAPEERDHQEVDVALAPTPDHASHHKHRHHLDAGSERSFSHPSAIAIDDDAEDDDEDAVGDDGGTPLLFRVGSRVIADRYRSLESLKHLQQRGYFRNVPLCIIHGTADKVIPFDHGVLLADAARGPTKEERVHLKLLEGLGHNNVVAIEEIGSFLGTEVPCIALRPGATEAASALVLPREHCVPAAEAIKQREAHIAWIDKCRIVAHFWLGLVALAVIAICAVLHPVMCNCCYDAKVVSWGVLEGVGLALLFAVSLQAKKHSLAVSDEVPGSYVLTRLIGYAILLAMGYLFGPILVWAPTPAGVDWDALHGTNGNATDYAANRQSVEDSRDWCVTAPRYTMATVFGLHVAHLLWTVIRNK